MRRILLFTLLAAAVLSAAAPAEAQRRRYRDDEERSSYGSVEGRAILGFHLGPSSPTGDLGDEFDGGLGFGGSLGYGVSRSLLLSVGLSHHEFDNDFDHEVSVTPLTFNLDYVIPTSGSIVPWVGGGIGAYSMHDELEGFEDIDETNMGFNLGAGIAGPVARRTLLGAGFRWHSISGDELDDATFFTFQVGVGLIL